MLNRRYWEHFSKEPLSKVEVKLDEIKRMIDVVYDCDEHYNNQETDKEKVFNKRIIGWTRYSQYANIVYLMKFNEYRYDEIDELLSKLSKLFIIYSLKYAKAINEIHTLLYNIRKSIVTKNILETEEKIKKLIFSEETIKGLLSTPIATMSTPVNKNLICRISEYLLIKKDTTKDMKEMVELLFKTKVDIEHIHANADGSINLDGNLQNSIGNLMLLEYDIN